MIREYIVSAFVSTIDFWRFTVIQTTGISFSCPLVAVWTTRLRTKCNRPCCNSDSSLLISTNSSKTHCFFVFQQYSLCSHTCLVVGKTRICVRTQHTYQTPTDVISVGGPFSGGGGAVRAAKPVPCAIRIAQDSAVTGSSYLGLRKTPDINDQPREKTRFERRAACDGRANPYPVQIKLDRTARA